MADAGKEEATVLVVDDEPGLVDLYVAFLEPEYDVRTATSGNEALQTCDEMVDVVLLDRQMPDMSGDEVVAELRQRNFDVRAAMLTAAEPDQDIVEMPFDDYKLKPVERSDLLSLVDILLKRATYNERSQELFSLASKKADLETNNNDATEEYEQLVERMQELRSELDATVDELCPTAVVSDFRTHDG
jgi:DNA-binding response OmpR family regulator